MRETNTAAMLRSTTGMIVALVCVPAHTHVHARMHAHTCAQYPLLQDFEELFRGTDSTATRKQIEQVVTHKHSSVAALFLVLL